MDMATFGMLVTQIFGWVGSAVSFIKSHELLLIPFGVAVVGAVVGILKRVFSGGRV